MQAIFFQSVQELHQWFLSFHYEASELWVLLHKKGSGKISINRVDAINEAICFGWTESRIKKIDAQSYALRLSPRKPGSAWSRKNIEKAESLLSMGLLHERGKQVYLNRDMSQDYGTEQEVSLSPSYLAQIQENEDAWMYFSRSSDSYRKNTVRWIMKAKREETRKKRLNELIDSSERGVKINLLS